MKTPVGLTEPDRLATRHELLNKLYSITDRQERAVVLARARELDAIEPWDAARSRSGAGCYMGLWRLIELSGEFFRSSDEWRGTINQVLEALYDPNNELSIADRLKFPGWNSVESDLRATERDCAGRFVSYDLPNLDRWHLSPAEIAAIKAGYQNVSHNPGTWILRHQACVFAVD
jgi:hypothetical protein